MRPSSKSRQGHQSTPSPGGMDSIEESMETRHFSGRENQAFGNTTVEYENLLDESYYMDEYIWSIQDDTQGMSSNVESQADPAQDLFYILVASYTIYILPIYILLGI